MTIMLTSPVPPFPWRQIKIGDSFFVPGRTTASLKGSVRHIKDRRFSFRQISLRNQVGCKVTRVEMATKLDRLRAEKERAMIALRKAEERVRRIDAAIISELITALPSCPDGGRMNEDSIGGENG